VKVFISWSGNLSHKIAMALQKWLPKVMEKVEPFISSENIPIGKSWREVAFNALENSTVGILCLTKENLFSPWMLFEAGALFNKTKQSLVIPFLIDLDYSEIAGPLKEFQGSNISNKSMDEDKKEDEEKRKETIKKLVISINNACGSESIPEAPLDNWFDKCYPDLKEKIDTIRMENKSKENRKSQNTSNHNLFFDCRREEFINYLVKSDIVEVIGITNEHLRENLFDAYEKRDSRKWDSIKVVFSNNEHLKQFNDDSVSPVRSKEILTEKWKQGISDAKRQLIIYSKEHDILVYPKILPFVGQRYNKSHIRIAHILSNVSGHDRCYLNLRDRIPPCQELSGGNCKHHERVGNSEEESKKDCETCKFWLYETTSCCKIGKVFDEIISSSTSLLPLIVSGFVENNGVFNLYRLLPEKGWTEINFGRSHGKPVFLIALLVLLYKDKILLHYRSEKSAGSVLNHWALIASKIKDEDIIPDNIMNSDYIKETHDLLKTYYKLTDTGEDPSQLNIRFIKQTKKMCTLTGSGMQIEQPIPDNILETCCNKAINRSIKERLGIKLECIPLKHEIPVIKNHIKVPHDKLEGHHEVYVYTYYSKINSAQYDEIDEIRRGELKEFTARDFDDLCNKYSSYWTKMKNAINTNNQSSMNLVEKPENMVTPFIMENAGAISKFIGTTK
jgi:hypothetical protein